MGTGTLFGEGAFTASVQENDDCPEEIFVRKKRRGPEAAPGGQKHQFIGRRRAGGDNAYMDRLTENFGGPGRTGELFSG